MFLITSKWIYQDKLKNLSDKKGIKMPRLTISLPQTTYNRLSSLSIQENDSLSNIINQLIGIGMNYLSDENAASIGRKDQKINRHCNFLIIQMNALLKNLSAEMLKLDQSDFEKLWKMTEQKLSEIESES